MITEDDKTVRGVLIGYSDGPILETSTGALVLKEPVEIQFPKVLDLEPTFHWTINSREDGEREIEVDYITGGISWAASYNLILDDDETSAGITSWVNLDNYAGKDFIGSWITLVAGDVGAPPSPMPTPMPKSGMVYEIEMMSAAPRMDFMESVLSELRVYELDVPISLQDRESTPVKFVTLDAIPVKKELTYNGMYSGEKVKVTYNLTNPEVSKKSLPGGDVRVYLSDRFIGSDRIEHVSSGEDFKVDVGYAFDIEGERVQTDFERMVEKRGIS